MYNLFIIVPKLRIDSSVFLKSLITSWLLRKKIYCFHPQKLSYLSIINLNEHLHFKFKFRCQ